MSFLVSLPSYVDVSNCSKNCNIAHCKVREKRMKAIRISNLIRSFHSLSFHSQKCKQKVFPFLQLLDVLTFLIQKLIKIKKRRLRKFFYSFSLSHRIGRDYIKLQQNQKFQFHFYRKVIQKKLKRNPHPISQLMLRFIHNDCIKHNISRLEN